MRGKSRGLIDRRVLNKRRMRSRYWWIVMGCERCGALLARQRNYQICAIMSKIISRELRFCSKMRENLSARKFLRINSLSHVFQVNDGRSFQVVGRFDTPLELEYFRNGGILNYMIRKIATWNVYLLTLRPNIYIAPPGWEFFWTLPGRKQENILYISYFSLQ